jgi:branched-chain amino acid transport system ATP-binding protein
MLEVNKINSFYGELQVLYDVSLSVSDGEFVVAFGPNGHGKSTLLKTICGLHTAASGSIKFDGKEISKLESSRVVQMGIVYVAEDRHLFPEMTVLENLKLGAFNTNARTKEAENLRYVLELFPRLKERIDKPARTLSGGEGRMLAIGRGLMSNAKFLAIDEPSLGLAPNLRIDVFGKISEINKERGITILMVEQNVTEALTYCDNTYLVEDGRIVFEGDREEIMKNKHVRAVFLGEE